MNSALGGCQRAAGGCAGGGAAAANRLVVATLADMHDEWQSGERRDLSEGSMAQLNPTRDTGTTAAIDSGA